MKNKEVNKSKNIYAWIENPRITRFLIICFIIICIGLFVSDLFYIRHPHFSIDKVFGFYGIYGFIMFTFIIFASKVLRLLAMRSEKFYGSKAVDSEEYPNEELDLEKKDVS